MFLNELPENSDVSILVERAGKYAKFTSEVITAITPDDYRDILSITEGKHFCLLKALIFNDKILAFDVMGLKMKAIGTKESLSFYWNIKSIKNFRLSTTEVVHIVVPIDDEGVRFNRRNGYRLWLGSDAMVKIRDSAVMHDTILKDLSITGLGLMLSNKYNLNIGDKLEVTFHDEEKSDLKKDYISTKYVLKAEIVRIQKYSDTVNIIGCTLNMEDNSNISKLINKKQQERMKLGGRNRGIVQTKDTELAHRIEQRGV